MKKDLKMLKSLRAPPKNVELVFEAVLCLLGHKDRSWNNARSVMADPQAFATMIQNYDVDNVKARTLRELEPYLSMPDLTVEQVMPKSQCAAGLCQWVRDVVAWAQSGSPAESISPER